MRKIKKILFSLLILLGMISLSGCIYLPNIEVEKSNPYQEVLEFLKDNYYKEITDDDVKNMDLEALKAYVRSLGDRYTYISPLVYSVGNSNQLDSETYVGMGITLSFEKYFETREILIERVLLNSDAHGKVYPFDKIIGFYTRENEKILFSKYENPINPNQILSFIKRNENEYAKLIIKRGEDVFEKSIKFTKITTPTIVSKKIDNNNGYIKITEFGELTYEKFNEALTRLENEVLTDNTKTLIIDVRNNPGGYAHIAQKILELFILKDEKTFLLRASKTGEAQEGFGKAETKKPYNIKLLVNNNSASASEVLASVMHYAGNYQIYGATDTFGKNVFQIDHKFTNLGVNLHVTLGYWSYYNKTTKKYETISKDNLIPVNKINQLDRYQVREFYFQNNHQFDEVSNEIILIQNFLRVYHNETTLRNDGYFDLKTKQQLTKFQQNLSIPETGVYDEITKQKIYDYILNFQNNLDNDYIIGEVIK